MPEGTRLFFGSSVLLNGASVVCPSVLFFINILFFNFGGVEGREAWCSAIPSACHMARPVLQQHE